MHNTKKHQQAEYNSKTELLNILKPGHRVEKIKIEVKQTDKITGNQQYAYVIFFTNIF